MSFGVAGREGRMDNDVVRVKVDHDTVYGYRRWSEHAPNIRWLLMRRSVWQHVQNILERV